jgi:two-component system OmpR family response regulator
MKAALGVCAAVTDPRRRDGEDERQPRGPAPGGILIVDDEPAIQQLLETVVSRRGFRVWLAANGNEAVEIYLRHGHDIEVVFLDVCMPGADGPATLAGLREINPRVCCCFMSGHTRAYSEADLLARGAMAVVAKPFKLSEIEKMLRTRTALVGWAG